MDSIRASCERCRRSKLKCIRNDLGSGNSEACQRCVRGGKECVYSVRGPTGRPPKKRKVSENGSGEGSPPSMDAQKEPTVSKRKARQPKGHGASVPLARGAAAWKSSPETVESDGAQRFSMHSPDEALAQPSLDTSPTSTSTATPMSSWREDTLAGVIDPALVQYTLPNAGSPWPVKAEAGPSSRAYPSAAPASNPMAASLADLTLAAFLESLDDVELTTSDGLTESMLAGDDSSAILTDASLAYAVPADFSWWNLSFTNADAPAASRSDVQSVQTPGKSHGGAASWPRGAKNGMGQGEIYRAVDGAVLHSEQWPEEAQGGVADEGPAMVAEPQTPVADCCSTAPSKTSCCSGDKASVAPEQEAPSLPIAPCCSKGKAVDETSTAQHIEDVHDVTAPAPSAPKSEPAARSPTATRVHCVPNPSGKGCTCLCDASVALLSVRRTLRAADETDGGRAGGNGEGPPSSGPRAHAAQTLHLTLSASQAVASQCACSADCSTCRSDPSTGISASLLVSTALQIYARAVRVLREGFGCSRTGGGSAGLGAGAAASAPLDVRIGSYRPSDANARRIALYAMRLELVDLRDALGKVSGMACVDTAAHAHAAPEVSPIDQLVIMKLYAQLGDVLNTVRVLAQDD